jgi:SpoIIAA-like
MLRRMNDMPAGTIGFEAVGEVDDDDWEDVVEPVLRAEIAAGRKVRLLYHFGPGAGDIEGDAMKADTGFRARHATDFERVAVVTDESWIKPALRALSFLMPGGARGFAVRDLPAAKTWLAEGVEAPS